MIQYKENPIVKYQDNKKIMDLLENNAMEIQKKAVTLGRTPSVNEIGTELVTYVSDGNGGFKEETKNEITDDVVIARNPEAIAPNVYNEWLVPKETWKKNYGTDAVEDMKEYQKLGTIKAIEITPEILKELGSVNGLTAKIDVSWSDDGMEVFKGGVLTDQGYGIAPAELKSTYQVVNNSKIERGRKI